VLEAIRGELYKLERPVAESEFKAAPRVKEPA
jgi:hypothetical protein